ncbi:Putative transcription factor capicua [Frankliniella fusca]|uniref:Transcription factor capicua n=1 Tax=Frankliniella fusca TaxID=407009 RepID=A0AAE1LAX9_9NEOP|nr:Putative transcription factor capicua [Frankliniella fusca]
MDTLIKQSAGEQKGLEKDDHHPHEQPGEQKDRAVEGQGLTQLTRSRATRAEDKAPVVAVLSQREHYCTFRRFVAKICS